MVGVQEVEREKVKNYGVIEPAGKASGNIIKVKSLVEKPEPKKALLYIQSAADIFLIRRSLIILKAKPQAPEVKFNLQILSTKWRRRKSRHLPLLLMPSVLTGGSRRGFIEANIEFAMNIEPIRKDVVKFTKRILKEYDY
jgi:UTP-glucose-1-phosphate uridylyltransferase